MNQTTQHNNKTPHYILSYDNIYDQIYDTSYDTSFVFIDEDELDELDELDEIKYGDEYHSSPYN